MAIEAVNVDITSNSSGAATVQVETGGGIVRQILINPDATDVPTASWDLTITDGMGASIYVDTALSESADTLKIPTLAGTAASTFGPLCAAGPFVKCVAANMGSVKKAKVTIYLET